MALRSTKQKTMPSGLQTKTLTRMKKMTRSEHVTKSTPAAGTVQH